MKGDKLPERERAFVVAFLGKCRGNGTEAVIAAGYTKNRKAAGVQAARLLAKARVQAELVKRREQKTATAILTAQARDLLCSELATDEQLEARDRLAAVKELNRVDGRHSITLNHKGKLTLEEALSASRKKE